MLDHITTTTNNLLFFFMKLQWRLPKFGKDSQKKRTENKKEQKKRSKLTNTNTKPKFAVENQQTESRKQSEK